MTDLVTMILAAIADVAPEVEPELAGLDHDVDFWRELQLDSMDHLAVMSRLSDQTGVDITEQYIFLTPSYTYSITSTPEAFAERIRKESEILRDIIKRTNVSVE